MTEIKGLSVKAHGVISTKTQPGMVRVCARSFSCICSLDSLEGGWQVREKSRPPRPWVVTGPLQSQYPPRTFTCSGPELFSLPSFLWGEEI